MNAGEAAATTGAGAATGTSFGVVLAESLLDERAAVGVACGFALLGLGLLFLAAWLGRTPEEKPAPTITVNVTGRELDDHAPEELFEAFQRALRRAGRSS